VKRRICLAGGVATLGALVCGRAWAADLGTTSSALASATARTAAAPTTNLTPAQSRSFRAWMVRIISAQLAAGPSPRWQQRDCAGLVRFAVAEALRTHDDKWRRANGLAGQPLPPEIDLEPGQQALRHNWTLADGSRSAYASALELVQGNSRLHGKDCNLALGGDLLFFDQGDAQHLMVWMGAFIAYHTGTVSPSDNGLRAVSLRELQGWRDTRWQPLPENPNFAGVYRLNFLSA
jgi:uncharacterized protein YfaT (DUF1175 family)